MWCMTGKSKSVEIVTLFSVNILLARKIFHLFILCFSIHLDCHLLSHVCAPWIKLWISWKKNFRVWKSAFKATRSWSQVDWGRSSSKNISCSRLYIAMFYMAIFICYFLSFASPQRFLIVEEFDRGNRPQYQHAKLSNIKLREITVCLFTCSLLYDILLVCVLRSHVVQLRDVNCHNSRGIEFSFSIRID